MNQLLKKDLICIRFASSQTFIYLLLPLFLLLHFLFGRHADAERLLEGFSTHSLDAQLHLQRIVIV